MHKLFALLAAAVISTPAAAFSQGNDDLYGWVVRDAVYGASVTAAQPGIGDRFGESRARESGPLSTRAGHNGDLDGSILYDVGHNTL